jgi:hypothetical protein
MMSELTELMCLCAYELVVVRLISDTAFCK